MPETISPELLRQRADDFEKTDPDGFMRSVCQLYRACADRISELEDTIDMEEAKTERHTHAASVLEEIASRRGKDWSGTKTLRQQADGTRDSEGRRYCSACKWFHPPGAHDPVCDRCECAHEYHDGPRGQCTNGAHSWSCDCPGYQLPAELEGQTTS